MPSWQVSLPGLLFLLVHLLVGATSVILFYESPETCTTLLKPSLNHSGPLSGTPNCAKTSDRHLLKARVILSKLKLPRSSRCLRQQQPICFLAIWYLPNSYVFVAIRLFLTISQPFSEDMACSFDRSSILRHSFDVLWNDSLASNLSQSCFCMKDTASVYYPSLVVIVSAFLLKKWFSFWALPPIIASV